jgi:hypothetical protein
VVGAGCEGAGIADHLRVGGVGVELSRPTTGTETHYDIGVGNHDEILVTTEEILVANLNRCWK